MSQGALEVRISELDGELLVELSGELDESAQLARQLLPRLRGRVRFDLGDLRRINSVGVRDWVELQEALGDRAEVELDRCSSAIVAQMNMIYNFRGRARVRSFLAPYVCER